MDVISNHALKEEHGSIIYILYSMDYVLGFYKTTYFTHCIFLNLNLYILTTFSSTYIT
jgi:hypothetical protein